MILIINKSFKKQQKTRSKQQKGNLRPLYCDDCFMNFVEPSS